MKRLMTVAACAALLTACQDSPNPLTPETPSSVLLVNNLVKVDPVLTTLLNSSSPTDKLQVLVTFDEALTSADVVSRAAQSLGAGVIRFKHLPVVFALATPAQVASLSGLPGVQSLYANKQLTYYAENIASIRADVAQSSGYTGKGVGIAILDSGVDGLYSPDVKHPTRTIQNVKYVADLNDIVTFGDGVPAMGGDLYVENVPNSETSTGHGTHVAGIAAGDGTASGGAYRGVAPGANIIGIGAGDILFVLWTLAGFDYILDNHEKYNIQVVNNSWGSTGEYDPLDPINVATKKVYDRGIAVVFAAGNEGPGENTLNPYSAAPWVISVAAGCNTTAADPTDSRSQCSDAGKVLADFSSRGIRGHTLVHPDITAPGSYIVAARASLGAVINGTALPSDVGNCAIATELLPFYTCISGTSMAAPHVAGAIALMEEASRGTMTPAQAYSAITRTARPLSGRALWEVGSGYLDAYAATRAVKR
ncbi:MAG TPA: S8 family serine peptidase [Longimicrobium sp.]|jgi:serine protease AprX